MTAARYIAWAASVLAGFAVMAVIRTVLDTVQNKWLRVLLFVVKFLLGTALGFGLIASASPFLWKYAYPLMGIYIALISDCICDIVLCVLPQRYRGGSGTAVLGIIVVVYALYGTVNSQIIREDHLSFSSHRIAEAHRFVFVSDLHYGSSQTAGSFTDALERICAASPEFILLGGDICDEHTEKEEMRQVFAQFGDTGIPVYFIYGNHDRQDRGDYIGGKKYTEEEFEQALLDSGIIILQDEYVRFSDDLVLFGREDISNAGRLPLADLPARPQGIYTICVDHSPYNTEDTYAAGADLQLSGHTHAGQIFPMRWLYTLAGLNVVYTYRTGSTDLYVSPGIGNWYYPFRNETHCSYAVIDMIPE